MNKYILTGLMSALPFSSALAQDLDITVTNLTHGSHFTPLLVAAHGGASHLFQLGEASSAALQAMAEGGDISGLSTTLDAVAANKQENPAAGLLAPGASTSFSMTTDAGNTYLSLVAMVLPSNDGFVGLDSLHLPTAAGTYTYYLNAYDAGTEANDEIVNGGGAPGVAGIPADPLGMNGTGGTGVAGPDSNDKVHVHRGVIGDTDAAGGASDLDSRIHRWLNPVAKITIEVK